MPSISRKPSGSAYKSRPGKRQDQLRTAEGSEMRSQELINTARTLVGDDKGLLAMDESTPTCNKRFAMLGIPQTGEARRAYRDLIVTTPGLGECISGAI